MSEDKLDSGTRKVRGLLAVLGLFLVLLGLILIYASPVSWDVVMPRSLWISVIGVCLFVFANFYRPGRRMRSLFARVSFRGAWPWVLAAAALSIVATVTTVVFAVDRRSNYLPALTLWFGAGMCYLIGLKGSIHLPTREECGQWFRLHRNELLMVGAVVLLGATLRFYRLSETPRVINGDEGRMGIAAQSTDTPAMANPFALWENFGSLYLQVLQLTIKAFGTTPLALRILPALGGILAIPVVYLFARLVAGRRVALISAILVAISHTHMHFSRSGTVGYIQDTWLVPLELYLLYTGIDRRSSLRAGAAGVLLAIHFSIYLTSQMAAGLIIIYLLVALIFFFRSWLKPALRQVGAFWGGFAIMILPEAWYVATHPLIFLERLGKDGVFMSGWLETTMAGTGKSAVQLLAERVVHAFLSLIYFPSIDFYGSSVPMFSLISATLFLVGMAYMLFRRQSPATVLLNGAFWAFTFAIGIFAIPPSADSYRMLVAFPAAIVMAAIGLDRVLELVGLGWTRSRLGYLASNLAVLASLLIFNVWTYYDDFAGRCLYGDDLPGRFASYLGNYARTVERGFNVYLLSDERYFYGSHDSAAFLAQGRTILNFPDPVDQLSLVSGESIVAGPTRSEELRAWALGHPQGDLHYVYDCQNLIMLTYQAP